MHRLPETEAEKAGAVSMRDTAIRQAARRAFEERQEFWVYEGRGEKRGVYWVRPVGDPQPEHSEKLCIAQYWCENIGRADGAAVVHTVQVRFNGGWSDWLYF